MTTTTTATKILYGRVSDGKLIDITARVNDIYRDCEFAWIPTDDWLRCNLLVGHDPIPGHPKFVYVVDEASQMVRTVPQDHHAVLHPGTNAILMLTRERPAMLLGDALKPMLRRLIGSSFDWIRLSVMTAVQVLHTLLELKYGSWHEELPEQLMATAYIRADDRVLEFGSNIGRNTLIIAALLDDPGRQLVTVETDPDNVAKLKENLQANRFDNVRVINAGLSAVPLLQRDWVTCPEPESTSERSQLIENGYKSVATVTWNELVQRVNSVPIGSIDHFDVIVADCEGAMVPILASYASELLGPARMVIIENDFSCAVDKARFDRHLTDHGFECVYHRPYPGPIGPGHPFEHVAANFFQVWRKEKTHVQQ